MYKFLGKKGALYQLDLEPISIKLNYNCPADYKNGEGQGSCKGYKPGSETLDSKKTIPAKKAKVTESKTSISSDIQKTINKVKSGGKITKEEYDILKPLVDKQVDKQVETYKDDKKDETYKEYTAKLAPKINEIREAALKEFSVKNPMPEPGIKLKFGGDTLDIWKQEFESYAGKKLEEVELDDTSLFNKWSRAATVKSQERERKRLDYVANSVKGLRGQEKLDKLVEINTELSGKEPAKETKEWFAWEQKRLAAVISDVKTRFGYLIGTDTSNATKKIAQDIIKTAYKKFETEHPKPNESDRDKKIAWEHTQNATAEMELLRNGMEPAIDMYGEWISRDKHYSYNKQAFASPPLSEIVSNHGSDSEQFKVIDPTRYDDPILSKMRNQMETVSKNDNARKAFYEYTREGINGYESINSKAAKGELTDAAKVLKESIDKTRLEDDIITYRGLGKDTYDLMVKQGGTEVGKIVTMKTFTSTSVDPDVVQKWFFEPNRKKDYKQTVIELQMKKGTPAAYLSDIEGDESEWIDWKSKETKGHRVMPPQGNAQLREVLVNQGTKFEVVDVIETPKLRKLIWRSV